MRIPYQSVGVMRESHFNTRTMRNKGMYPAQLSRTGRSGFTGARGEIRRDCPKLFGVNNLSDDNCLFGCRRQCAYGPAGEYLPYHLCMAVCVKGCSDAPYGPTSVYATPEPPPWWP